MRRDAPATNPAPTVAIPQQGNERLLAQPPGSVLLLAGQETRCGRLRQSPVLSRCPYKIAANLPFYMASPLIRKFLESDNPPLSLTVIVQKEVAQRVCAKPPKMNLLAVSVQFYAAPKIISCISKGAFWPTPKVDCAILQIVPYAKEGEINFWR